MLRSLADKRDLPPSEVDLLDRRLMEELSALKDLLEQYIARHHYTEAGRATSTPVADERALADTMAAAGQAIRARAERRKRQADSPAPGTKDA